MIEHEFRMARAIVSADHYAAMLRMESMLGRRGAKTFLLEANDRALAIP